MFNGMASVFLAENWQAEWMMLSALRRGRRFGTERGDLGCVTLFFVPYNTSLFGALKVYISILVRKGISWYSQDIFVLDGALALTHPMIFIFVYVHYNGIQSQQYSFPSASAHKSFFPNILETRRATTNLKYCDKWNRIAFHIVWCLGSFWLRLVDRCNLVCISLSPYTGMSVNVWGTCVMIHDGWHNNYTEH